MLRQPKCISFLCTESTESTNCTATVLNSLLSTSCGLYTFPVALSLITYVHFLLKLCPNQQKLRKTKGIRK